MNPISSRKLILVSPEIPWFFSGPLLFSGPVTEVDSDDDWWQGLARVSTGLISEGADTIRVDLTGRCVIVLLTSVLSNVHNEVHGLIIIARIRHLLEEVNN